MNKAGLQGKELSIGAGVGAMLSWLQVFSTSNGGGFR